MSDATGQGATPGPSSTRFSRRGLLAGGLGVAGLAIGAGGSAAAFELHARRRAAAEVPAPSPPAPVRSFRSRADLSPPRVQMTLTDTPTTDAFLLAPTPGPGGAPGQPGLMILDGRGQLTWFRPMAPSFANFRVQSYRGQPVLTWWQGQVSPAGFGQGTGVIADTSYRQVATINGANGLAADLHELVLTPEGTALVTAYGQTVGPGTTFAWQHDARAHGNGEVTLFDDGASPPVAPQSRALRLAVDPTMRTATLTTAFTHPARLLAQSQGNFQRLADGGGIVGWGSEPYFSHFDSRGDLVRDGRMPTNMESYRAFRSPWSAAPSGVPDIATEGTTAGAAVYVSWNGATRSRCGRCSLAPTGGRSNPAVPCPRAGSRPRSRSTRTGGTWPCAASTGTAPSSPPRTS